MAHWLMKTGFLFPFVFGAQAAVGALLVFHRFVPLALALPSLFIVNDVAFYVLIEVRLL